MEKSKVTIQAAQQLAEARAENLKQVESATLRPHGKMWGMDVFSWYNPLTDDLLTLFQSFPAPITWIGDHSIIKNVFSTSSESLDNLSIVCAHNHGSLELENASYLDETHGAESIKQAFEFVKAKKQKNGIIFFTASGSDWANQRDTFEYHLKIEQA